ncbi:MAG: hypothetical protein ACREYF_08175 [Gammaproteobacteria bacterium]
MKSTIQTVLGASVWGLAINTLAIGIVNDQAESATAPCKAMIAEARTLWREGKAMQEMMEGGESSPMAKTHQLAEAGKKVLDLLAQMPELSK